jgi:hypothetical protein
MMMMSMIIIILGHKCICGTIVEVSGRGRGKERILRGEEDGNMPHSYVHTYEDSIMNQPNTLKERGGM